MSYQPDALIKLIDSAFDGVVLGNGVSLHESEALDMYEGAIGRASDGPKNIDRAPRQQ